MVLAVLGVVIQAETMNMQGIVERQNAGEIFGWDGLGNPYILTQFIGFAIFMIAVQAELTQTPFDMPIAESELVVGLHDGVLRLPLPHLLHRRVRDGRCVRADRQRAVPRRLGRAVQLVRLDTIDDVDNWMNVAGPVIMITKMLVLTFLIMWVRFSYPDSARTNCSGSRGRC